MNTKSYDIIEHKYDVIVVGAGGAGHAVDAATATRADRLLNQLDVGEARVEHFRGSD